MFGPAVGDRGRLGGLAVRLVLPFHIEPPRVGEAEERDADSGAHR